MLKKIKYGNTNVNKQYTTIGNDQKDFKINKMEFLEIKYTTFEIKNRHK